MNHEPVGKKSHIVLIATALLAFTLMVCSSGCSIGFHGRFVYLDVGCGGKEHAHHQHTFSGHGRVEVD